MSDATVEEDAVSGHRWHPFQTRPFDPPRSRGVLPSWMSYSNTRQLGWTTCVWLRRRAPITGRPLFFNRCSTAITAVDTTYQPDMDQLPLETLPWGWEERPSLPSSERYADLVRRCASDTDPRLKLDVAYVNGFLCRHCQRMVGDNISSIEHLSKDVVESPAILDDLHGSSAESFAAAVKQGCFLCCVAQKNYEQSSCLHPYRIRKYLMGPGSIIALSLECSAGISCLTKSKGNTFVCFETLKPIQFKMLEPKYIPRTTNTSDGTVLGLASEWIKTCCTFHEICRKRGPCESKFLPARLIDIGHGNSYTWKLVITRGTSMAPVEYIALSYCWGASTQLRLTASTQDSFIKGMPVSALTRTHRDLITVARSLGIRWLWIDALCILQDSKSDWTLQSLEMAEIYSNCKLTVAAAASSDSQGGLFRDRQIKGLSPLILRQPNRAYLMHSSNYWGEHLEDCSPLFKRGWALQERLLPKRVIYFSHQQIFFECRFNRACEGFPCGGVGLSNRLENLSFFDTELAGGGGISSQNEQNSTRQVRIWSSVVNKYQSCDFTFPSDKLIALSGAIKTIELQTGDKFHAGLWKSRILFYLGWNSRDRGRCRLPEVQTPSWSWMSMRGTIAWETEMEMMLNIDLESAKVPLQETMPLAHVVDISTERRTNEAQDQLRVDGSILLKGSLVKARLLCSTSKAENGGAVLVVTKYGRYMLSETQEPIYLLEMDMNPCLAEAFPDIDASAMPQGSHLANVSFHGFDEGHEYNLFGHKLSAKGGETTSFRVVPMATGDIFALPLYAGLTKEGSIISVVGLIVTQKAHQGENRCMERVGMFRLAARVGITKEDMTISLGTDKRIYRLGGTPEPVDITLF